MSQPKLHRLALACLAVVSVPAGIAPAQEAPPASAPASAPVALEATITGVEGTVQVRDDANSPWRPAAPGMVLGEGAEFRTGLKSAVRFVIPPSQTITLDRLGTCKLLEAVKRGAVVKTDLGMQYGRVRYDIEAVGISHDAKVHSPGATMAVRGTRFSLFNHAPFKVEAVSLTGEVELRRDRKRIAFGGKGGKAAVRGEEPSAASAAMAASMLATPTIQRTEQQIRELAFLFDQQQGGLLGNVATSEVPVTDAQLPSLFGDNRLNFVLRWSEPEGADLNLFVRTPAGEIMSNPPFILSFFPGNPEFQKILEASYPSRTASGGQIGLNHIGPEGIEIANFKSTFPTGVYLVGAFNFIPPDPDVEVDPAAPKTPFRLEVFLDGKRQGLVLNAEEALAGTEDPICGFVFTGSIAPGQNAVAALPMLEDGSLCGTEELPTIPETPTQEARRSKARTAAAVAADAAGAPAATARPAKAAVAKPRPIPIAARTPSPSRREASPSSKPLTRPGLLRRR